MLDALRPDAAICELIADAYDLNSRLNGLYRLQHAQLQTVADIIKEAFNKGRQRRSWETPDPTEVAVRSDDNANVLIVSASAKEQDEIKALISGIDAQLAIPEAGGTQTAAAQMQIPAS